ncbi:MAG: glycosyltransferase family 2 protein [Blastocatellia bacterium]
MKTPVAFIIFNRPDFTNRVFEEIALARPRQLLVIADGSRTDRPGEAEKCAQARKVIERVDWECEVLTNFSEVNLGCKMRPLTGINWVFEQVEEAIILEDDCLPDQSFFPYCEELLERYRDDQRVMMVSGVNFFGEWHKPIQSYYFSRLASSWGWATWRRAWCLNDPELTKWPLVVEQNVIEQLFSDPVHQAFWKEVFRRIIDGELTDAWDYQWLLTCWLNSGYRIFPEVNLISNIGFRDDATHTFGESPHSNMPLAEIALPLKHPQFVVQGSEADYLIQEQFCVLEGWRQPPPKPPSLRHRVSGKLRSILGLDQ